MGEKTNITTERFASGLHTDFNPVDQPKNTYRFALNAVNETKEGDMNFLSNEEANIIYIPAIADDDVWLILGGVYIDDDEHIIFIVNYDNTKSKISILKPNKTLTHLVEDDDNSCLNFQITNQILGTYRLRNGCEKTVYWVDGLNEVRSFSPSRLDRYLDDTGNIISCSKFSLVRYPGTIPTFESIKVTQAGQLLSGSYNFAIQYVDENDNNTVWITASMTVPIYKSIRSGDYDSVLGSSNSIQEPLGYEDQAFGSPPTNKAIEVLIGNIDTNYAYYRVACIEATSGTGLPNRVLISANIPTTQPLFIHDGNLSKYTEGVVEEILVSIADIGMAKYLEQLENRLLIANVSIKDRDYCNYQRFASAITAKYIVDKVPLGDYNAVGDCKNPQSYFMKVSYMGGEVYAFGIVYIFPNGVESPAYHIPGRPPLPDDLEELTWDEAKAALPGVTQAQYEDSSFTKLKRWELYDTSISLTSTGEHTHEGWMSYYEVKSAEYIEAYDCIENTDGYWGKDGYPAKYGTIDWGGTRLVPNPEDPSVNVRHHRFPTRHKIPHVRHDTSMDVRLNTEITVSVSLMPPCSGTPDEVLASYEIDYTWSSGSDTISGEFICKYTYQNSASAAYTIPYEVTGITVGAAMLAQYDEIYINGVLTTGTGNGIITINSKSVGSTGRSTGNSYLLGIKFENIQLPPGVVGYRIVRAKRDNYNRTVLAKGFSGTTRFSSKYLTFNNFTESTGYNNSDKYNPTDPSFSNEYGHHIALSHNCKWVLTPEYAFFSKEIRPLFIKTENWFIKSSQYALTLKNIIQNVNDESTGWFDGDGFDWDGLSKIETFWLGNNQKFEKEQNYGLNDITYLPQLFGKLNWNMAANPINVYPRRVYNVTVDTKIGIMNLPVNEVGFDDYPPRYVKDSVPEDYTINLEAQSIIYIAMMALTDVHPVLDNIKYFPVKNNITYDVAIDENFGGDTFISHFYLTSAVNQFAVEPFRVWDFIVQLLIVIVAAVVAIILAVFSDGLLAEIGIVGVTAIVVAIGISATIEIVILAIETFADEYEENHEFYDMIIDMLVDRKGDPTYKDDTFLAVMEHAYDLWIESDINVGLREPCTAGFPGILSSHGFTAARAYITSKFLIWDDEEQKYHYSAINKPEVYHYNEDFSRHNEEKLYFPLPYSYDCCSDCLEEYPDRVYYSEQSFLEEHFDSFGHFLPLNYITIPGEHGEITNVFSIKNALFVHTESNLWYLPQNIQERLTGDVISLVGTGGFFASPPRKIYDTDIGSAGSNQPFATIKTKFGTFFVSVNDQTPYLMNFGSQSGTQVQPLNKGISKWFATNIPLILANEIYQITEYDFPNYSNPVSKHGTGFIATMDYEYNRIILTKIDYSIIDKESFIISHGGIWHEGTYYEFDEGFINKEFITFNTGDRKFWKLIPDVSGEIYEVHPIDLFNEEYFENKSWTMSYSFNTGTWVSFHSYIPAMYLYDYTHIYSQRHGDNGLWIHNEADRYQTYYDVYYPFIVDYVANSNPLITSEYADFEFITQATKSDIEQRYVTFNKMFAYNSRQSTGLQEMICADDNLTEDYMNDIIIDSTNKITLRKKNKNWRVNDLRDYRFDYDLPLFYDDWQHIKSTYFIDKVLNEDSINYLKDWNELEPLKDKYLRIRLIFDNESLNDIKLITNFTMESEQLIAD